MGKITFLRLKVEDKGGGDLGNNKKIMVHSQELKRCVDNLVIKFNDILCLGEQRIKAGLIWYLTQNR